MCVHVCIYVILCIPLWSTCFSNQTHHPFSPPQALESFSYFSLSLSITDYLTSEHGVDDVAAGILYGLWGTMIVALGVIGGGLIDAVGVRSSLLASAAATAVARATLAMTRSRWIAVAALLGPRWEGRWGCRC